MSRRMAGRARRRSSNLDNSASGATTTARITTRTGGAVTPVVDLRNDFLRPVTDNVVALGGPSNRFTTVYAAGSTISTSDKNAKQDIGAIPDEWLDAWGEVEWCRFRFREAVAEKGDAARWHVGLIAQHVRDVFAAHGIDALTIGLLCYDEWDEIREPVFKKVKRTTTEDRLDDTAILGPDGTPAQKKVTVKHHHFEMVDTGRTRVVREAGSLWGLRYEECFALEAARTRRELSRIHGRFK